MRSAEPVTSGTPSAAPGPSGTGAGKEKIDSTHVNLTWPGSSRIASGSGSLVLPLLPPLPLQPLLPPPPTATAAMLSLRRFTSKILHTSTSATNCFCRRLANTQEQERARLKSRAAVDTRLKREHGRRICSGILHELQVSRTELVPHRLCLNASCLP